MRICDAVRVAMVVRAMAVDWNFHLQAKFVATRIMSRFLGVVHTFSYNSWRLIVRIQVRGQYMITAMPAKQSVAPMASNRSGVVPAIAQPHTRESTTNIPP